MSGILYPILILTLFLIVQILTMMASRKAVLDKNKQQLLDSVNASNKIYNNEELSILLSNQQEEITSLKRENQTLKSQLDTTNNTMNNLSSDISNNYASKSYVSTQLSPYIPQRYCSGSGTQCTIRFSSSSATAICFVGPATGGQAGVSGNTGIYYIGWHSPDGVNRTAVKAIIENSNGLQSVSASYGDVTFTGKYPTSVHVRCYNF